MAFENFRQTLHACFIAGVTGGHTVGHIQVADDVHRNIYGLLVRLTGERQGADPTVFIARLQIDQHAGGQFAVWIVEGTQARVENTFRQLVIFGQREPFFIWIVNERAVSDGFAQPEVSEEIVGGQTLKILTQRRGQCRFFCRAFTVGKAQGTVFIANMHGPDVRYRIEPGGFFDVKTQVGQFLLEASDGIFQSGVFAGDKRLSHGVHFYRT